MSEISNHKKERTEKLLELFLLVIREELNAETVAGFEDVIKSTEPADVIAVVDELVKMQVPISELKKGINKTLNLLSKTLQNFPHTPPAPDSFLFWLVKNNEEVDLMLKAIRPSLKKLNQNQGDQLTRTELAEKLIDLSHINLYYQIKENVLFPVIEKYLPDYRCLQIMWSFHDDIRRNIKEAIKILENDKVDISRINRLSGDIFFNIYAIRFREERILFPVISAIIPENELNAMLPESIEIGFPFVQPELSGQRQAPVSINESNEVDLKTGCLSPEQIRLVFNHLPVDITYVDENNKVKFFSTPEKRIFRRTNSIIGRDLKNCHPQESVHVVEQIVEAFRNGVKDRASFWIRMKDEMILIQYFAVRNENGTYKGVVEVTQEISEIQTLNGERRLLEWEN